MIKRLINLKSALLSFNLKTEAAEIDKLIKLAVPIEGIVSPGETSRRYSETGRIAYFSYAPCRRGAKNHAPRQCAG